jgi:hypothetical protein
MAIFFRRVRAYGSWLAFWGFGPLRGDLRGLGWRVAVREHAAVFLAG